MAIGINDHKTRVGIDMGGTQLRAGVVNNGLILKNVAARINAAGGDEEVLDQLFELVAPLISEETISIGIGVPSVVDVKNGIVYDVQNIPSWKEVHLKQRMEKRFGVPVTVNNDANCFALAEYFFGTAKGCQSLVGLTIGTGLGAGIVIQGHLYSGYNCGAGEFGMVPYLDSFYEHYASGQFFTTNYHISGEEIYKKALDHDDGAMAVYQQFGQHLGNAIKTIIYTYDPETIILGGSIRQAYSFFERSMWEVIHTLVYPKTVERLKLELSDLDHAGILGAAMLSL